MTNPDPASSMSLGHIIQTRWLHPRRKRFWVIVVVLLYTLLGLFAAPPLIRSNIIQLLEEDLGRPTSIEKIEINPFYLSLRVQGLEIKDVDGVKLAELDELYVNFQFLSLLKWAWTFSQIELSGPYLHFERLDSGETRLDRLLSDFASARPADTNMDDQSAGDAPRLIIRNLDINDGHVDFMDSVPETPVELKLSPINISIQELNTLPGPHGEHTVDISLPNNASLKWSGSLGLAPFESNGKLELEGLHIDPVTAYLEPASLESVHAILGSDFQYHLQLDHMGEFRVDINALNFTLDELLVSGLEPVTEFIDIPELSLLDGKLRYPEKSLHFSSLNIRNPQLKAWINEDGSLSIFDLLGDAHEQPHDAGPGHEQTGETVLPWRVGIGEFVLDNGGLALTDRSIQPNTAINIEQLQVGMSKINNDANAIIPFEIDGKLAQGGSYSVNGNLGVLPDFFLSGNAGFHAIPLSLGQAYIKQFAHITVENGVLKSSIEFNLAADGDFSLGGSAEVPELELSDTINNQKLLSWEMLDIDQFELNAKALRFSQLNFTKPYGRFVIQEDLTTNLAALMLEQPGTPPAATPSETVNVSIGGMRFDDGSMDFADFSLPLPFATHVAKFGGTISTIDTSSAEPANIRLEGQVDEYGLARVEGSIDMLDPVRHTDIMVEFRNLLMSSLTPYTVAFAGHSIEQGKLDLSLGYSIYQGQLQGTNDIVLSDLVLGEKVDHPDAESLPLGLAVSLLKDSDGVIRIDLPVEGDINDPAFKFGGVIWQAFTGMIKKLVAAPFRLLGNLIGIESEDFGKFEFLAGRSDLTPPELEKIVQLESALQQRPELVVVINGVTSPAIDIPALKSRRLRAIARQRLQADMDENMMLDEEIRTVVETMFTERFPDIPSQSLKAAHTAPPADDPEGKPELDELAWATDMWNRLLASEVITGQDLTDLALARAQAIKAGFIANGQVDAKRIVISETKEVESEDGEWVELELAVTSAGKAP